MKLKYYLRGLGIGIVITAILMGVATKDNGQMTDAEIKARAAQLGMVEQKVLADISNNEKPVEDVLQPVIQPTVPPDVIEDSKTSGSIDVVEPTEEPENTKAPENIAVPEDTETPENIVVPKETDTPESTEAPVVTDAPESSREAEETVLLTVRRGASSWAVSKDLAESGLVEDAAEFDKYLSQGGYDKSICVGEFSIQMGASYEEIAKIITKRN